MTASIKDAINYAVELIYELNSRLEKPLDNPFELLDDLEKENILWTFVDQG